VLEKYKEKRDFNKTAEPDGGDKRAAKSAGERAPLAFVIQHHFSRREHYDFRLEWHGVLLSWAVPKGVSTDPHDKRLAIHVEDHPLEYRHFEGTIPAGEYGAGEVFIWDKGTYEPLTDVNEALDGKHALKIMLHGEKLKGLWTLVKTTRDPNHWLIFAG
jgi:bifunctional non-homologous end joining protein LigD